MTVLVRGVDAQRVASQLMDHVGARLVRQRGEDYYEGDFLLAHEEIPVFDGIVGCGEHTLTLVVGDVLRATLRHDSPADLRRSLQALPILYPRLVTVAPRTPKRGKSQGVNPRDVALCQWVAEHPGITARDAEASMPFRAESILRRAVAQNYMTMKSQRHARGWMVATYTLTPEGHAYLARVTKNPAVAAASPPALRPRGRPRHTLADPLPAWYTPEVRARIGVDSDCSIARDLGLSRGSIYHLRHKLRALEAKEIK